MDRDDDAASELVELLTEVASDLDNFDTPDPSTYAVAEGLSDLLARIANDLTAGHHARALRAITGALQAHGGANVDRG